MYQNMKYMVLDMKIKLTVYIKSFKICRFLQELARLWKFFIGIDSNGDIFETIIYNQGSRRFASTLA